MLILHFTLPATTREPDINHKPVRSPTLTAQSAQLSSPQSPTDRRADAPPHPRRVRVPVAIRTSATFQTYHYYSLHPMRYYTQADIPSHRAFQVPSADLELFNKHFRLTRLHKVRSFGSRETKERKGKERKGKKEHGSNHSSFGCRRLRPSSLSQWQIPSEAGYQNTEVQE
jgi:hypothetical protein